MGAGATPKCGPHGSRGWQTGRGNKAIHVSSQRFQRVRGRLRRDKHGTAQSCLLGYCDVQSACAHDTRRAILFPCDIPCLLGDFACESACTIVCYVVSHHAGSRALPLPESCSNLCLCFWTRVSASNQQVSPRQFASIVTKSLSSPAVASCQSNKKTRRT